MKAIGILEKFKYSLGSSKESLFDDQDSIDLWDEIEEAIAEVKALKADNKEKDARITALCNPPHRGVYE